MNERRQEQEAIEAHSQQASLFTERYATLGGDPYGSGFAYSRHRLQAFLACLLPDPAAGARLLDVGCGTGHHLAWARGRGFDVAGIDGSEAMLDEARRFNPGVELRRAEVDALPFAAGSFDSVLCIEVLRYLPETGPCIREMARVLRSGGTCLATASPLFNLNGFPLFNRLGLWLPSLGLLPLKQFFHTSLGLKRRFRREGFSEVDVRGVYLGAVNWVERVTPGRLPKILRSIESCDAILSDLPLLRDLSGMLLVHAVR